MRYMMVLVVLVAMNSCAYYVTTSSLEYVDPRPSALDRFMGLPTARECSEYAHDGDAPDHKQWAKCMNVEFK